MTVLEGRRADRHGERVLSEYEGFFGNFLWLVGLMRLRGLSVISLARPCVSNSLGRGGGGGGGGYLYHAPDEILDIIWPGSGMSQSWSHNLGRTRNWYNGDDGRRDAVQRIFNVQRDFRSTSIKKKRNPWPPIETRKYHRGASVPKQIWPLPGTKYYCQRTKNRDFRQLTRVQWKNVNHIAGGVVQVHCSNSYNTKYAPRATSNQFWPLNYVWRNS